MRHRVNTTEALDGAHALLEALASRYRLAIITNGGGEIQRQRLKHAGLESYFDVVVASSDIGAGKPDTRIFHHALKELDVAPDEAWHVGDGLVTDVVGALNAGLQAAVWYNSKRAGRTGTPQPTHQITSLGQLRNLL